MHLNSTPKSFASIRAHEGPGGSSDPLIRNVLLLFPLAPVFFHLYSVAPAMAPSCDIQALCVLYLPSGSMKCTMGVNVSTSLSLGTGLTAVCTTAYQPLPVRLDLHCAPGEAVGVKQQVASLRLDVLPVATTRGCCEHKHTYIHKDINIHNLQNIPIDL